MPPTAPSSKPFKLYKSLLPRFLLLLIVSILLISCETVSYYSQAARGQAAIVLGREDIQNLLDSDELPQNLQEKFTLVLEVRQFAEQQLLLPVNDNYSNYVDLNREHVVWNVFAAPEFSVDPINWCFPIAGCVSYRGYFSESAAIQYAEKLKNDGYDVYTGGVDAYSTLGWFEDPLLSSVLTRPNHQLAALIFHELAHQLTYLPGDTRFNESFATAVEREGLRRWLQGSGEQQLMEMARLDSERQEQFVELIEIYQSKFEELFSQGTVESEMRRQKGSLQAELREEYQSLKQQWDGYAGYDNWFNQSLNNAQLSTVSSYNQLVPFFNDLLVQSGGDLQQFYAEVQRISELSEEDRVTLLPQI